MPVAIVWLVMRAKQNETNKMAEIMLKAIEAGIPLDPDFFKTQTRTLQKSLKERQLGWLTAACILIALGLGSILVGAIIILINNWTYDTAPTAYSLLTFAGGLVLVIGIALLVVYFIRKRILAKELEAEREAMEASMEK
jgi:hypothetical protein